MNVEIKELFYFKLFQNVSRLKKKKNSYLVVFNSAIDIS